ncbi:hypothetical protein LT493_27100 [Streptomyces tricolor]|nr:hypothetical protein [Streptomyces tricolor]
MPWAGGEEQRDVVRGCFREWQDLGIGVTFAEVGDRCEAELRIGFQAGAGSWSAVGREALSVGRGGRTMNLGWDVTSARQARDRPAPDRARTRDGARTPESVRRATLGRRGRVRRAGGPGPNSSAGRRRTGKRALRQLDACEAGLGVGSSGRS